MGRSDKPELPRPFLVGAIRGDGKPVTGIIIAIDPYEANDLFLDRYRSRYHHGLPPPNEDIRMLQSRELPDGWKKFAE
jgi:hypothetical protein